jgi:hypothetical protein
MPNPHALADKVGVILLQKVERRLEALLAEHGASDPGELPRALQGQLLRRAILETAGANFPAANLEMLKHGFRSFAHPAFITAMERMRLAGKSQGDAFEMTRGIHAAVVLAGYGLPVAPFDLETMRILAKPSNDIDTVQSLFSLDRGAFVGYSTCEAPFYLLLTDCVRSLRRLVPVHPRLSGVKELFARANKPLPPDPGQSFMHGMAVIARQTGDTISTVGLFDPDPMWGSINLYAGWQVDGEPFGAPNEGYVPVPGQLLRAVVHDPRVAYSFWLTAGAPTPIH